MDNQTVEKTLITDDIWLQIAFRSLETTAHSIRNNVAYNIELSVDTSLSDNIGSALRDCVWESVERNVVLTPMYFAILNEITTHILKQLSDSTNDHTIE